MAGKWSRFSHKRIRLAGSGRAQSRQTRQTTGSLRASRKIHSTGQGTDPSKLYLTRKHQRTGGNEHFPTLIFPQEKLYVGTYLWDIFHLSKGMLRDELHPTSFPNVLGEVQRGHPGCRCCRPMLSCGNSPPA